MKPLCLLLAAFLCSAWTSASSDCEGSFLTGAEYQERFGVWVNTYAVRPIVNRGESSLVPVGGVYHVGLTQSSSLNAGTYNVPFPTPLLSVSPADGVFSKFYNEAMTQILATEYTVGKHPMNQEMAQAESAKLNAAKLDQGARQIFYFTTLAHSSGRHVGAFVELYDSTPIEGEEPLTALETRLNWRHPHRDRAGHVIIELRRGYVGRDPEVHELAQSNGLMRKVATYIDQNHLSQGRKVTLVNLTFGETRARVFDRLYGFDEVDGIIQVKNTQWHVMDMDGKDFVAKFGSDRATLNYHEGYRHTGFADPLFNSENFRKLVTARDAWMRRDHEVTESMLRQGRVVASGTGHPPLMSLEDLGTFEQHSDGYFQMQGDDLPLLWF